MSLQSQPWMPHGTAFKISSSLEVLLLLSYTCGALLSVTVVICWKGSVWFHHIFLLCAVPAGVFFLQLTSKSLFSSMIIGLQHLTKIWCKRGTVLKSVPQRSCVGDGIKGRTKILSLKPMSFVVTIKVGNWVLNLGGSLHSQYTARHLKCLETWAWIKICSSTMLWHLLQWNRTSSGGWYDSTLPYRLTTTIYHAFRKQHICSWQGHPSNCWEQKH